MTTKISQLPTATTPDGSELVPLVQGGVTKQTTSAALTRSTTGLKSDLAASSGSSLVGHIANGTGAVARTEQTELRELHFSVKHFGAVGDGATLDDTAILNAYTACPAGGTLFFPLATSGYLISAKLTVAKKIRLEFEGGAAVGSGDYPGSYLLKKSTMAATAVDITANGVVWDRGGVIGQGGNTGDGIAILANNVTLDKVGAISCGNDNIRIGSNAGVNANTFLLIKPVTSYGGRHGIYIDDASLNANAGTIILPFGQANGGDSLKIDRGFDVTVNGILAETNTGAGIHLASNCRRAQFFGGDVNEGNGTDILVDAGALDCQIDGVAYGTITDNGTNTLRPNKSGQWTPVISGTSTAGAGTYSQQFGWYTLLGNILHYGGTLVWSAHTGTGNVTLAGLPYPTPNVAGRFSTCQFDINSLSGVGVTTQVTGRHAVNVSFVAMNQYAAGVGSAVTMANAQTGNIVFSGFYRVN